MLADEDGEADADEAAAPNAAGAEGAADEDVLRRGRRVIALPDAPTAGDAADDADAAEDDAGADAVPEHKKRFLEQGREADLQVILAMHDHMVQGSA